MAFVLQKPQDSEHSRNKKKGSGADRNNMTKNTSHKRTVEKVGCLWRTDSLVLAF